MSLKNWVQQFKLQGEIDPRIVPPQYTPYIAEYYKQTGQPPYWLYPAMMHANLNAVAQQPGSVQYLPHEIKKYNKLAGRRNYNM